jgi:hypothetical protein
MRPENRFETFILEKNPTDRTTKKFKKMLKKFSGSNPLRKTTETYQTFGYFSELCL